MLIVLKRILFVFRTIFFFFLGFFVQRLFKMGVFPLTVPYIVFAVLICLFFIVLFFGLEEIIDRKIDKKYGLYK